MQGSKRGSFLLPALRRPQTRVFFASCVAQGPERRPVLGYCTIRHIGARQFGLEFLLRGLYVHNNLLYFHLSVKNETYPHYPIDMISFKVVDKKVVKRTAIQERVLQPLRAYNQPMRVRGNGSERMVFAFEGFSLPDDKQLEVTIHERNGGRTLFFRVQNEDLLRARRIDHLKLQWR